MANLHFFTSLTAAVICELLPVETERNFGNNYIAVFINIFQLIRSPFLLFLDMNFDFDYKKFSFDHPHRKGITTLFD